MALDKKQPNVSDIFDKSWHDEFDAVERRALVSLKATKDRFDLTKHLVAGNRNITAIKHERAVAEFLVSWGEGRRVNGSTDMMVQMLQAHARYERNFQAMNRLKAIKDDAFDKLQEVYAILRALQKFHGEFAINDDIEGFSLLAVTHQKFYDGLNNYILDHQQEYEFWRQRRDDMYRDIKAQTKVN